MSIINYEPQSLRNFAAHLQKAYENNLKSALTHEIWMKKTFENICKSDCNHTYPYTVKIAPKASELLKVLEEATPELESIANIVDKSESAAKRIKFLKSIIKPAKIITINEPIVDKDNGCPLWFEDTLKGINMYPGLINGDFGSLMKVILSDPVANKSVVDFKICGGTGSGKTVAMHTLILNLLLMTPPWELNLMLIDLKLVEFIKYYSPVPCPGIGVIGVTSNTTYITSMLSALSDELLARQKLFNILSLENIVEFRRNYDMVMPRYLLVADEYPQYSANIKEAEAQENANAKDELNSANLSLFRVSTLGRSQGMHMIISGQNTCGLLEETTDAMFAGGLALKCNEPAHSTDVIGNEESVYIREQGVGFVNLNKGAGDKNDNRKILIPFVQSKLTEEEITNGEQTYLTKKILQLNALQHELLGDFEIGYFNSSIKASSDKFDSEMQELYSRLKDSPFKGTNKASSISRDVYKKTTMISFYLGEEVRYSEQGLSKCFLDIERLQNNNIIVSGNKLNYYALKMLAKSVKYLMGKGINVSNYFYSGNQLVAELSEVQSMLEPMGNFSIIRDNQLPFRLYGKIASRVYYMSMVRRLQEYNDANNININRPQGIWDTHVILDMLFEEMESELRKNWGLVKSDTTKYMEYIDRCVLYELNQKERLVDSTLEDEVEQNKREGIKYIIDLLCQRFATFLKSNGLTHYYTESEFSPMVVWMIGPETYKEVIDKNTTALNEFKKLLTQGPSVNVLTIMCSVNWTKSSYLAECFNYIIEKETKSFFTGIGLPVSVNATEDVFQVHNRETKKLRLVKNYNL